MSVILVKDDQLTNLRKYKFIIIILKVLKNVCFFNRLGYSDAKHDKTDRKGGNQLHVHKERTIILINRSARLPQQKSEKKRKNGRERRTKKKKRCVVGTPTGTVAH